MGINPVFYLLGFREAEARCFEWSAQHGTRHSTSPSVPSLSITTDVLRDAIMMVCLYPKRKLGLCSQDVERGGIRERDGDRAGEGSGLSPFDS